METTTYILAQPNSYDTSEFAGTPSGTWEAASDEVFDSYDAAYDALREWQRYQPEVGTLAIMASDARGPESGHDICPA